MTMTCRSVHNAKFAVVFAVILSVLAGVLIACKSGAAGGVQTTAVTSVKTTAKEDLPMQNTTKEFDTTAESEIIVTRDKTPNSDNDVFFDEREAEVTTTAKKNQKKKTATTAPKDTAVKQSTTAADSETEPEQVTDKDGFINRWY